MLKLQLWNPHIPKNIPRTTTSILYVCMETYTVCTYTVCFRKIKCVVVRKSMELLSLISWLALSQTSSVTFRWTNFVPNRKFPKCVCSRKECSFPWCTVMTVLRAMCSWSHQRFSCMGVLGCPLIYSLGYWKKINKSLM